MNILHNYNINDQSDYIMVYNNDINVFTNSAYHIPEYIKTPLDYDIDNSYGDSQNNAITTNNLLSTV